MDVDKVNPFPKALENCLTLFKDGEKRNELKFIIRSVRMFKILRKIMNEDSKFATSHLSAFSTLVAQFLNIPAEVILHVKTHKFYKLFTPTIYLISNLGQLLLRN